MTDGHTDLVLPWLGRREYLHGTTLFEALVERSRAERDLCFKVQSVLRTNRIRIVEIDPSSPLQRPAASLSWSDGDGVQGLWVLPLEPTETPQRAVFDEAQIVAQSSFVCDGVCLKEATSYPFIYSVVALNKALLLRSLSPPQPGQWLFTRLDLARVPTCFLPLRIRLETTFHHRLVRSSLMVDADPIGDMYFSWGQIP